MKQLAVLCISLAFFSCASGKGHTFTGSTPAGPVVREFLGIPPSDPVDFIRWLLEVDGTAYKLSCNYGIGKPNTNGFMDGGRILKLSGILQNEKGRISLLNEGRHLVFATLNTSLIHPLDQNSRYLSGTGGWSYTLTRENPVVESIVHNTNTSDSIKDSAVYVGRTPCGVPGLVKEPCGRLKWHFCFFSPVSRGEPGLYRIRGTLYGLETKTGKFRIITTEDGTVHYELLDEKSKPFLYFIKGGEEIILVTDAQGKLLAGNEDFSYTLSRDLSSKMPGN